jgi:hypothetical protein
MRRASHSGAARARTKRCRAASIGRSIQIRNNPDTKIAPEAAGRAIRSGAKGSSRLVAQRRDLKSVQVGMAHAMMALPGPIPASGHHGAINMRKIVLLIAVLGVTVLLQLYSVPAYAVAINRTWVSHSGNDGNPCTESQPCLTFGAALTNTKDGGEIDCLDPGDYSGQLNITISVTIDCHDAHATIFWEAPTGDGVDINAPGKTVILRNISFNTIGEAAGSDIGIDIIAAQAVYIEDCVVAGYFRGINDVRTAGATQLFIKNTVVRNNHFNTNSPGIVLAAAPKNAVVLENVQSLGNGYGIAVATGNNVVISRSVMSGNGIAGIEADPGAQVLVDNTEISHNGSYGVEAFGTVALANSDISFNTSSIFGSTVSYGNNRLFGNGGGTAPTPAGGTSTDFGQQ